MKHPLSLTRKTPLALSIGFAIFCAGCATAPDAGKRETPVVQASQLLKKADAQSKNSTEAVGLYLNAARSGLALAGSKTASQETRTEGRHIYNEAVVGCVLALQKRPPQPIKPVKQEAFRGGQTNYDLKVVSTGDTKNPATFDRFVDAAALKRKAFKTNNVREGLGGALVGVMDSTKVKVPNRAPAGFAEPITAVVSFGQSSRAGAIPASLSFLDPRKSDHVTVDGSKFVLEGDFTAPLAFVPEPNAMLLGIAAMLRSDKTSGRAGIYFCEPYDPQKIPVLFVHGLMSSPHAWIGFINELNSDQEFRRRYQAWVFFYPTGSPIAGNALLLRRSLAELQKTYPNHKPMVVVGHSMGGILTQMQVTNSKSILWDFIFGAKAKELDAKFPNTSLIKQALFFQANPHISKVIFIATPHLGSNLADLRIASLAARLIRLPVDVIKGIDRQTRAAVMGIIPGMKTIPTSIVGLSPKSPLLKGVAKLPITVPYYSIIGNQGKDNVPLAKSSDGVVPYWSSHIAGEQSEIIVPTGHDAFDSPKSVAEVLRILALKN